MSQLKTARNTIDFTGNWFIDIGILGFVNVMEEVYGWDLDKLRGKLNEPEKVYYGYFPFAYFSKLLKDYIRSQEKKKNSKKETEKESTNVENDVEPRKGCEPLIKKMDLRSKLEQELESKNDKREMFDLVWCKYICELYKDAWIEGIINRAKEGKLDKCLEELDKCLEDKCMDLEKYIEEGKLKDEKEFRNCLAKLWLENVINSCTLPSQRLYRLPIDSNFYKNFKFFNNQYSNKDQYEAFYDLISYSEVQRQNSTAHVKHTKETLEIDKALNKFLPSIKEFPNIFYAPLNSLQLIERIPFLFVYLICFIYGFTYIQKEGYNKYIVFYSNNIEFSYRVNKILRIVIGSGRDLKGAGLLAAVWGSIIDVLIEYKSTWSLENMYLIEMGNIKHQEIESVEYIGIPRLQASIIIDDTIRKQLSFFLRNRSGKYVKVIEEFVEGKPLYPLIQDKVKEVITKKRKVDEKKTEEGMDEEEKDKTNWLSLLYCLVVDAKIMEMAGESNGKVFDYPSSDTNRDLVDEIKGEVREVHNILNLLKGLDRSTIENVIDVLFEATRKKDKNMLLYALFRTLNAHNELCANRNLIKYIQEKIISNTSSYYLYGLALVIGLLRGLESSYE